MFTNSCVYKHLYFYLCIFKENGWNSQRSGRIVEILRKNILKRKEFLNCIHFYQGKDWSHPTIDSITLSLLGCIFSNNLKSHLFLPREAKWQVMWLMRFFLQLRRWKWGRKGSYINTKVLLIFFKVNLQIKWNCLIRDVLLCSMWWDIKSKAGWHFVENKKGNSRNLKLTVTA